MFVREERVEHFWPLIAAAVVSALSSQNQGSSQLGSTLSTLLNGIGQNKK